MNTKLAALALATGLALTGCASSPDPVPVPPAATHAPAAPAKPAPKKPTISLERQNAVRAAEDYLNTSSFSRKSLIEQLKYEHFSTADATYAVDHVEVDWNAEAADAAQSYLDTSAFSHQSLVEQLTFEGFTKAQAEYGVKKAGL